MPDTLYMYKIVKNIYLNQNQKGFLQNVEQVVKAMTALCNGQKIYPDEVMYPAHELKNVKNHEINL